MRFPLLLIGEYQTTHVTWGTHRADKLAFGRLANFIVLIATPVLFTSITYKTYIFFAVT